MTLAVTQKILIRACELFTPQENVQKSVNLFKAQKSTCAPMCRPEVVLCECVCVYTCWEEIGVSRSNGLGEMAACQQKKRGTVRESK